MNGDIIDRIDAATGCQQCGGPLGASPSGDWCSEHCQQTWLTARTDAPPWATPIDWSSPPSTATRPAPPSLQAETAEHVQTVLRRHGYYRGGTFAYLDADTLINCDYPPMSASSVLDPQHADQIRNLDRWWQRGTFRTVSTSPTSPGGWLDTAFREWTWEVRLFGCSARAQPWHLYKQVARWPVAQTRDGGLWVSGPLELSETMNRIYDPRGGRGR